MNNPVDVSCDLWIPTRTSFPDFPQIFEDSGDSVQEIGDIECSVEIPILVTECLSLNSVNWKCFLTNQRVIHLNRALRLTGFKLLGRSNKKKETIELKRNQKQESFSTCQNSNHDFFPLLISLPMKSIPFHFSMIEFFQINQLL